MEPLEYAHFSALSTLLLKIEPVLDAQRIDANRRRTCQNCLRVANIDLRQIHESGYTQTSSRQRIPGRCRHRDETHLVLLCGPRAFVDGSQYTSIPVPLFERVIKPNTARVYPVHEWIPGPAQAYVVQQFIPGRVLHDA